jgi:hypothetical protein
MKSGMMDLHVAELGISCQLESRRVQARVGGSMSAETILDALTELCLSKIAHSQANFN